MCFSEETALQPENYVNTSPINKLHNVNVAFQLMEDAGLQVRKFEPLKTKKSVKTGCIDSITLYYNE